MKKGLLIISIIALIPLSTYAWNSKSTKQQILQEFSEYIQPSASATYTGIYNTFIESKITQGNMSALYTRNDKTLTDQIIITINGKTRKIPGPWSHISNTKREAALKNIANGQVSYSFDGFYDFNLLKLSPSGNYIEMIVGKYENWSWVMLDSRTGNVVLEGNTIKSMWSSDRKQFIFQICTPIEITSPESCNTGIKTFITKLGKFPQFTRIQ